MSHRTDTVNARTSPRPLYAEGWDEYEDASGQPFYSNKEKGESQWEHPLQRYYHGLVWMVKEGNELLEQRRAREPPEDDEIEAGDASLPSVPSHSHIRALFTFARSNSRRD